MRLTSLFCLAFLVGCGLKQHPPGDTPVVTQVVRPDTPPTPQAHVKPTPQEKKHKVGLLLPLSGSQHSVGHDLLNAAHMSLFDTGRTDIEVLVEDTKGSPEGAHKGAQRLIDRGVTMVVGPLTSREVKAVKSYLHARKTPMVAFTSDRKAVGPGAYTLGLMPSQQIQQVVRYARANGISGLVALVPDNAYGRVVEKTLKDMDWEIHVRKIIRYKNPAHVDAQQIGLISGDAILAPEGGKNLLTLVDTLRAQGVPLSSHQWLGSSQWDDARVYAHSELQRGWFAGLKKDEWKAFQSRYEGLYGREPSRLATLAYDGMALAAMAVKRKNILENKDGFDGIDGSFVLEHDGNVKRDLDIFEVTPVGPRKNLRVRDGENEKIIDDGVLYDTSLSQF